jgi:hypothetical protein
VRTAHGYRIPEGLGTMALFRLSAIDLRTIVASPTRCHVPREAPMVRNELL